MGRRRSLWRGSRRRSLWPRRRRSNSGDAALALLVLGAVLVAALGIYLLILGAIAVVGWLVAVAARSQSSERAVFTETPAAPPPLPPNQTFHSVLNVDPAIFASPQRLEEAAIRTFSIWASQLPSAPRNPEDAIKKLTFHRRLIGRLTTRLDGRRFVWRSTGFRGRGGVVGGPPLRPENLDPYNPPEELRSRSRYLSLCTSCHGDGKVECAACGGAAKVSCDACGGAGKVEGLTKNNVRRLLNCKTCKGKSTVVCGACTKGALECRACERSGRLEHWLELEGGPRDADVQVEPDGQLTQAFRWGADGVSASDVEVEHDARRICSVTQTRLLTQNDLPHEVPHDWRDNHWAHIQARLHPGERVVEQTFTLLEVPCIEVTYGLDDDTQAITLEGLRMLAPPITSDFVFANRATALRRLMIGLALLPLAILLVYAIRGAYFFANPLMLGVMFCTAIACAIVYIVFHQSTLGRAPKKLLAAAVLPIGAAVTLAIVIEPSSARARALIDQGLTDQASVELEALGSKTDAELTALWADLHLKKALSEPSCEKATQFVQQIPAGTPQHSTAQDHADRLALAAATAALKNQELDVATRSLECASETARTGKPARAVESKVALVRARLCAQKKDWACVFDGAGSLAALGATSEANALRLESRAIIKADVDAAIASSKKTTDLDARVRTQRFALELWNQHLRPAESDREPAPITELTTQLKRDEQALARAEQLARQKREAEERRQAEIAAREERQRQAAEERERRRREALERLTQPQGLLCCDGSMSPTCSCGGSHRGCCSHHGGVCGCR